MIKIVFIGNGFNNRLNVLKTIDNCKIDIVSGIDEDTIMKRLPIDVIDLFVVDRTKPLFRKIITLINADASINHIPIISLITKRDLQNEIINDGDLFVSEFVTDIEFKYYVKAMIKMKLMDDELKKEKIVLELKVKERTKGLQESEKKYRRIYNNVPDLIYTLDLNGKILTVNDNVRKLGYKPQELIGQNISYVLDEKDLKKSFENIEKKKNNPSLITRYNVNVKKKNGDKIILEVNSHFIDDGKNTEIFVIGRDVTETIMSQKIIEEEQERYHYMFENMKSCVAVFKVIDDGNNFTFTGWNKIAEKTEKVKKENIIGEKLDDIFHDLENTGFIDELKYVYKTGKPIASKPFFYENKKTGVKGWRENFIYKLKKTGEIVSIYDDITERVEYQEELKKAKEKAEQSDKLKSMFISTMSHEIRTPMNSIIGFTSLLENETNAKKIKNYIEIISNSGNLLVTLIDDIMDLSKMETGSIKIKKEKFNLNKLLKDIKSQFNLELEKRDKKNISIIIENEENYDIYTDNKRLSQILNNLILNSIKFTNEGYIKYGFKIKDEYLEFYVEDTGIGIKKENIELVFERFYQIDRDKIKKQEGTGIGLTICKAIIELLGGKMWIESEYNIGTTVYFTIPIEESIEDNESLEKENNIINEIEYCKNILIIDDNDTNYELLYIILLSANIITSRAKNNIEFLNKIDEKNYDLILLDLKLSKKDNWFLLNWIKENKKDIPIIIQTSSEIEENEIKTKEMESYYFISKPINARELLNKIKIICSNSDQ
jgi:PAS domain S-box-containing protein